MLASLVMFVALLNYKQGFLLYLLLQMIWFPDTQLFYIGSSSINLNFICALYFVGLYIIKKKKKKGGGEGGEGGVGGGGVKKKEEKRKRRQRDTERARWG